MAGNRNSSARVAGNTNSSARVAGKDQIGRGINCFSIKTRPSRASLSKISKKFVPMSHMSPKLSDKVMLQICNYLLNT